LFFAESLREFRKFNLILFIFLFIVLFFRLFDGELRVNHNKRCVISLVNFLIVTILNQCTDVLCSTSYLKYSFFLKHFWIQFIRFEFILVFAVSEHIVLTHTPRVDFIFIRNNGISEITCRIDISDFLLLFIIDNVIFESKVPKELISYWTSKVANGTKILLFGILCFFN
jgi:hypothetical protein